MCGSLGYSSKVASRVCTELSPEGGAVHCWVLGTGLAQLMRLGKQRVSPKEDAQMSLDNLTMALPLSRWGCQERDSSGNKIEGPQRPYLTPAGLVTCLSKVLPLSYSFDSAGVCQ